jgi:hypothetical protein
VDDYSSLATGTSMLPEPKIVIPVADYLFCLGIRNFHLDSHQVVF